MRPQFTALKIIELGGTVLSLSDSQGTLLATGGAGYTAADVAAIGALKLKGGALASLADAPAFAGRFAYHAGARPWTLLGAVHIALPCATQNEISGDEARALIAAGARIVAEGSNMVRPSVVCEAR